MSDGMGDDKLVKLVPARADPDLASEFRSRAMSLMQQLAVLQHEARGHGMIVQCGTTTDQYGRFMPNATILKQLA